MRGRGEEACRFHKEGRNHQQVRVIERLQRSVRSPQVHQMCFYIHFLKIRLPLPWRYQPQPPSPVSSPHHPTPPSVVSFIKTGCLDESSAPSHCQAQGTAWANARPGPRINCVSPIVPAVRGSPGRGCEHKALPQPLQLSLSAGSACRAGAVHQSLLRLAGLVWDSRGSALLSLGISAGVGNSRRSRRVLGSVLIPLIAEHKAKQASCFVFTAALGFPRSPSDPCCGLHASLVLTVKVHDALSSPPCRGLPCMGSSRAVCAVVGSCCPLPGIPSTACTAAPGLETAEGMISCYSKGRGSATKIFSLALLVM